MHTTQAQERKSIKKKKKGVGWNSRASLMILLLKEQHDFLNTGVIFWNTCSNMRCHMDSAYLLRAYTIHVHEMCKEEFLSSLTCINTATD